jgi:hypothetical protein
MQEAGHTVTLVAAGYLPEFVEVYRSTPPAGRMNTMRPPQNTRLDVSASGYAAELALFNAGRLLGQTGNLLRATDAADVKQFIWCAIGANADDDKTLHFGGNFAPPGQSWPAHMDQRFMGHASPLSSAMDMQAVETLATALLKCGRLSKGQLGRIACRTGLMNGRPPRGVPAFAAKLLGFA